MLVFKRFGLLIASAILVLTACAPVDIPDNGSVDIKPINQPMERVEALNENHMPITRVRLGGDMLVPKIVDEDKLPKDKVGPFELRSETLASALQLVLDDYDLSIAFETNAAFEKLITVANLKGNLDAVVDRICALADLYCHFEKGNLTVKERETFMVDLPPIGNISADDEGSDSTAYTQISSGLEAIIGEAPTIDDSTRILIYTATQRTNKYAKKYFEKLRKNTALIVFETHIWEVTLDHSNRTGIKWDALFSKLGTDNWNLDLSLPGASGALNPMSITPGYTGSGNFSTDAVLEFLSSRGAVKTISQPQITMLSGSSATLTVTQEENFVSGLTRTENDTGDDTVSTTTETVETGLNMTVKSAWDESTIYGGLSIELDDLLKIEEFQPDANTTIQLPQTTTRSLETEVRVRPGDAILIGGLVSEKDTTQDSGPGFMNPLFSTSRTVSKENTELVFLLRPRVVVFEMGDEEDDAVQAVNASHSGLKSKMKAISNLTDKVQDLFTEPDSPLVDLTSKVGDMLGLTESKEEHLQLEVKAVDKIETKAPVRLYGEPASSPRDLLDMHKEKTEQQEAEKKTSYSIRSDGGYNE